MELNQLKGWGGAIYCKTPHKAMTGEELNILIIMGSFSLQLNLFQESFQCSAQCGQARASQGPERCRGHNESAGRDEELCKPSKSLCGDFILIQIHSPGMRIRGHHRFPQWFLPCAFPLVLAWSGPSICDPLL